MIWRSFPPCYMESRHALSLMTPGLRGSLKLWLPTRKTRKVLYFLYYYKNMYMLYKDECCHFVVMSVFVIT